MYLLTNTKVEHAWTYLQLPLRQWGAGNVYLLALFRWKVNIAKKTIVVTGTVVDTFEPYLLFHQMAKRMSVPAS